MWELQAHGSAAPAPGPAAADGATGSDGAGVPPPRLDPLGSWCSARLTFADGARIDVLVTVSDDHITVEDVRADPPLALDGLAELARWIEGPLDDAFRAATGRPRRTRSTPRQSGPAAASPECEGGVTAGPARVSPTGPAYEPAAAGRAPGGPTGRTTPQSPAEQPLTEPPRTDATPDAGTWNSVTPDAGIWNSAPPDAVPSNAALTEPLAPTAGPPEPLGPTPAAGDPVAPAAAEPGPVPAPEPAADEATEPGAPPAPAGVATSGTEAAGEGVAGGVADGVTRPAAGASATGEASAPRTRSALLARSRAAERRKLAADAYRQAQREGRDPVLAVMLATGRNRRRALRLIAGARDEGLLTPRHNKR
ncbi:DUF6214 family protein [Streptomyces sp. NPDC056411]|uniref:DUF6214 family protein n=1 Tax=Streptomyces sp. NPDC056411 TaxID=3345813 RepID=UPI0035E215FC